MKPQVYTTPIPASEAKYVKRSGLFNAIKRLWKAYVEEVKNPITDEDRDDARLW